MSHKAESPPEGKLLLPLELKLILALLAVALILMVFLFVQYGPEVQKSFLNRSDRLIGLSREALAEMVQGNTQESKDLLINLIRHTAESRRRQMVDLPLELYGGDLDRIRKALEDADAAKSSRLQENVKILAQEMERRSLQEVNLRLEQLAGVQATMGAAFAEDVRGAYLLLVGGLFSAICLLLGLGLYRTVVHPLKALRRCTRAVARGDLGVEVPIRSRDEVGGLAADFSAMVSQLRASQADIERKSQALEDLNRNLEAEVARKTRTLEDTLDDLKRTQRQLLHAEKMASIGTLAGGVAHEFNNLIGGIRGCVVEALETETDSVHREPLEVIQRAAVRAGEITDQLLRFSRQRTLTMRPADVTNILKEALLLVEPDARKRRVDIVRKIEPCKSVPVDSDALHQVFLNLYTNALQAMPDEGTLTVETESQERKLVVHIRDTGEGIPADRIDRIFEPFFTTKDQASDPAARGLGLGLSVSYSIVEAHGGTLEVSSEAGKGAVFTVSIPVTSGHSQNSLQDGEQADG